jgi:hypothetical protein
VNTVVIKITSVRIIMMMQHLILVWASFFISLIGLLGSKSKETFWNVGFNFQC